MINVFLSKLSREESNSIFLVNFQNIVHVSVAVLGMKGFKKFFMSKIVKNYEHFQEKEKKMFANSKFYEQNCSQFNY